jgi:hypothetical protein
VIDPGNALGAVGHYLRIVAVFIIPEPDAHPVTVDIDIIKLVALVGELLRAKAIVNNFSCCCV